MGKAAVAYFEQGADLSVVAEKVVEVRDAVAHRFSKDPAAAKMDAEALADEVVGAALPPAVGDEPAASGE